MRLVKRCTTHAFLPALLGAALLAGCGDSGGSGAGTSSSRTTPTTATPAAAGAARRTDTIKIADFVYAPTPATVRAGDTITIANADAAPHTITDGGSAKAFDSGTIKGKSSGSLTIGKPGTYSYICEFHPFMKGEITVTK